MPSAIIKKLPITTSIVLILSLLLQTCASSPKYNSPKTSKQTLKAQTKLVKVPELKVSTKEIRLQLEAFKRALKMSKLNKVDWRLHDKLLDYYIKLKHFSSTKIVIPPHTRITLPFETYCLNSGRASPSEREVYHWQKGDPKIDYYKQLLDLRRKREISRSELQELVWNLNNETYWDDYPSRLKAILQKIDPRAAFKLPSRLKSKAKSLISDYITDIPGVSEALDAYELTKGRYYSYKDFKESVESIQSKHALGEYDNLTRIPGTKIFSQSNSSGYEKQKITFYNPSDEEQTIDITEYYLAPQRKDVQRIGINTFHLVDPQLLRELEKILYDDMARLGIGFTPGINDVADIYELLTGRHFISGESLSAIDRTLSGVGIIIGSGAAYRYTKRAIYSPPKYIDKFAEGLSDKANKTATLSREILVKAKQSIQASKKIVKSARKSGLFSGSKHKNLKANSSYETVKSFFRTLGKFDVPLSVKKNLVKSFDLKTIKKEIVSSDIYVYRWHNNDEVASKFGRFVSDTLITHKDSARKLLALPAGNKMLHLDKFMIKRGTEIYRGKVAPSNGHIGGGSQIFITGNNVENILIPVLD